MSYYSITVIIRCVYVPTISSLSLSLPPSSGFRIIKPKLSQETPKPLHPSDLYQYQSKPSSIFNNLHHLSWSKYLNKWEWAGQRYWSSFPLSSPSLKFPDHSKHHFFIQFSPNQEKSSKPDAHKVCVSALFDFTWSVLIANIFTDIIHTTLPFRFIITPIHILTFPIDERRVRWYDHTSKGSGGL